MNQTERRIYLIQSLLEEEPRYAGMRIPSNTDEQKRLLRSLMNIRMPHEADDEFYNIQNQYLTEENEKKGIVTLSDMEEVQHDIYIWQ